MSPDFFHLLSAILQGDSRKAFFQEYKSDIMLKSPHFPACAVTSSILRTPLRLDIGRDSVQLSALQKSWIRAEILERESDKSAICLFWLTHKRILLLGLSFCLLPPSVLLGFSCYHFMVFQQSWLGIFFSDVFYGLFMVSRSTIFHINWWLCWNIWLSHWENRRVVIWLIADTCSISRATFFALEIWRDYLERLHRNSLNW